MAETLLLAPWLPLIVGSLLVAVLRGRVQDIVFVATPALALILVWSLPQTAGPDFNWLGLTLTPVVSDSTARLFGTAFALAAIGGAIFALPQRSSAERAAALLYAGAAQGVIFAGDLVTLFLFWEVMAIGSALVIFSNGASRAGLRYALMHAFGGVLFFAGIAASIGSGGTAIRPFAADSIGSLLMLAGILVNAGAPPVSAWVADAYPRASWSGAVFLSAFTTKAAIAVLIRLFPGEAALIPVGLIMAVYGMIYALLENDIRRMLSYSIVGQVGFMVVAIGIGTPLALAAAGAHAFVHILYKGLLMMAAGTVLRATGTARLTALGGLARSMPFATCAMIVGGLSLSAMPLTAGFVSKSAIMQALADDHDAVAWFALTAISAGSMLYAGLRLPWFAMLRPSTPRPATLQATPAMKLAMGGAGLILLAIGAAPGLLMRFVPGIESVAVLTSDHILFQLQLLVGASICFVLFLRLLVPHAGTTVDTDWLWRCLPQLLVKAGSALSRQVLAALSLKSRVDTRKIQAISEAWVQRTMHAGNWRTGDIALVATALLGICLLIAAM
ncbi:multisubunit sodium/proton antiporter, MrpD subunit [Kaistia soli DSM 19436]|uniref:Multisubunit sodium/proton antiporter, MrpD subunit n=1 Tax=Kaistia soli DSM 19436 TaxID=1122133 RepID=A0A1M4V317_9HYPH|nr:proton-conducting transporter membrane subunit [Kaistia soli]SHE63290.1 multisubunit sodium/proton antiporter, MrpD subunit [Kaistia soli DSM 19436]